MNYMKLQSSMEEEFGSNNKMAIGRLLTVIDAALPESQAKAAKDIVKQIMWDYLQDEFTSFHSLTSQYIQKIENGDSLKIKIKPNE